MGDEKQYTIQVKGTAYKFAPISPEDATMLVTVMNMNASPTKSIKALMKALKVASGAEQWDAITDRMISDEITLQDLMDAFGKLMKRQGKDAPDDAE